LPGGRLLRKAIAARNPGSEVARVHSILQRPGSSASPGRALGAVRSALEGSEDLGLVLAVFARELRGIALVILPDDIGVEELEPAGDKEEEPMSGGTT
jgi:hypothetical protein